MHEIKCPKCGEVFQVDESGYAELLSQVRNEAFEEELHKRARELEDKNKSDLKMAQMQQGLNPKLRLRGLLPVMVDARPNIVKGFISYLRTAYGDNVTQTTIPRSVKVNEAQTKKQDIYEYKQWSPAANAYESLVKELFD